MLDEQEQKIAKWVQFGFTVVGVKTPGKAAEDTWALFTVEEKLKMTELFEAHKRWFKENT